MRNSCGSGLLFDVGANNGLFSLVHCLMNASSRAIAFEPSPPLAELSRELARLNDVAGRLEVVCKAVAEEADQRKFLLDHVGGCIQSAEYPGTVRDSWQPTPADTVSLDSACGAWGYPTTLTIDVEGYEHEALLGASELVARGRPTIFLELHLNYLEHRRISSKDVVRLLADAGYTLQDLSGHTRTPDDVERSWAAVLHLIGTPAAAVTTSANK